MNTTFLFASYVNSRRTVTTGNPIRQHVRKFARYSTTLEKYTDYRLYSVGHLGEIYLRSVSDIMQDEFADDKQFLPSRKPARRAEAPPCTEEQEDFELCVRLYGLNDYKCRVKYRERLDRCLSDSKYS